MLKSHWRLISRAERVIDNALIFGAFFLSYYARDMLLQASITFPILTPDGIQILAPIEEYLIVLGCGLPLFNAILSILGGYRSMRFSSYVRILRVPVFTSLLVFLCLGSVLYLLKLDLSRSFVGLFCVLSGVGLFLLRVLVLVLLRFFRVRGKNYRNLLVVGTGDQARRIHQEIAKNSELGVRVIGFVTTSKDSSSDSNDSAVYDLAARVIAGPASFETALKRHAVDEVLFTDVVEHFQIVKQLAEIAVEEGVRVALAADLFSLNIFKSEVSYLGGTPLVHYHPSPAAMSSSSLVAKRMMDVVVSAGLLLLLSPFLLFVALAIRLDSTGPVFFRQRRVGLNGRTFILLKFRSMVNEAEKMLDALKEQNEMSGPAFKIRNDPRITRVGRLLRRYSIDELPQLINVLRGDMSLVGPRPPLPEEVSQYIRKQRKRLSMRPGLTCTWQVSGRNEIPDFENWAKLDLEYIDNWSLWTDIKLLFQTIPAVLGGVGAR